MPRGEERDPFDMVLRQFQESVRNWALFGTLPQDTEFTGMDREIASRLWRIKL
jgi:hypothetical protein